MKDRFGIAVVFSFGILVVLLVVNAVVSSQNVAALTTGLAGLGLAAVLAVVWLRDRHQKARPAPPAPAPVQVQKELLDATLVSIGGRGDCHRRRRERHLSEPGGASPDADR